MFSNASKKQFLAGLATITFAGALLAGCAGNAQMQEHDHDDHGHSMHKHGNAPLHTHEMWAKSAAAGGMTAIFGNLHSDLKDKSLKIVKITSDAAEKAEIHEVVGGKMQEVAGGLTLKPGEELDMEPGGYHLMLIGLKKALQPGDRVEVTLHLADGTKIPVTADVRDASVANEDYDHDGHDHDDQHDHDHDHDDHDHDHDDNN